MNQKDTETSSTSVTLINKDSMMMLSTETKVQRLELSCNTIIEDSSSDNFNKMNHFNDFFERYNLNIGLSNSVVELTNLRRRLSRMQRQINYFKDEMIRLNNQLIEWEIETQE